MNTSTDLSVLVTQIANLLLAQNLRLVTAESCTGGAIAAALTERPGSSAWFERGFVTYSNASKTALLGVLPTTLESQGAVSEATAREMALGALKNSQAQVSLSVTGVAGPDGGTAQKPVGTVCFGWASVKGTCHVEICQFSGHGHNHRLDIRLQASQYALAGLLRLLQRC